jgi:hypothetical protein
VPQSISVDGYDYTVGIIDLPVNLAEPTPRALRLTNLQLLDPAPANGNGFAEPGETIRIVPSLLNTGFTLLENVTLRLVSTNPAVVPLEPLEAVFPAVASGITFSPSSSGLAAALDPSLRDGEPLGLSLQVTHDAGSQFIPLDLFAVKSTRADAELNFVPGAMLADTTRDVVYVSDTTNNRILSIDTNSGTVLAGGPLAGVIGRGDIALSADGGSIAVALFESSRVHILSSTTLASREVLHLNFKPVSVAFGANGRLYASNGVTSSRLSEFDPERGTWTFIGSKFHRSSNQLRSSIDRSRLFVCEVGYSGTSIAVDEYSVAGDTSSAVARPHFYKGTGATGDIALDEAQDRFFAAMAATHGLQVTALRRGLTEGVWPFAADQYHGKGCALTHDGDFIYAGSAAANGMIRRYERWGGRPLADFPLKAPGVSMVFYLIERGIVVTPNQRVLFATRNQSTSLAATRHFLGLLGGDSLNMTIPLARPKVDAGQDRTVKLSKPLTFQPVLELPSGSGTATTTWTKVSGPGAVVTSTQGGMTTVNFSQPGRYQMQFAATVDGATSTDSVWVDVQPDDPWVNLTATSAKAMRHPGLFGGFVLSREGDPSMPLTVQLQSAGTAVAGTDYIALPSSVVMAAGVRSVDIPLVLLPGEGAGSVALSVLRGTAYEPGSSASATITIAPASLANWLEAVRDARPELDFSALGDANGNGLSNLMEYLLGRDPLIPSHVHPMATTVEGHPRTVTASYRALKNPVGASLAAEFSNNLFQWHTTWEGAPALTVLHREDHGDGTETITVRLNPAAATEPAGYLRLKAVEAGD